MTTTIAPQHPHPPRLDWLTKVPVITATFWVIKILSTTVGETFADFLTVNVGLGPAVTDLAMLAVLAVALTVQLRKTRYTPWIYWLCVVLVSIVGTQITDFFTDTLGVSLYVSTAVFAVAPRRRLHRLAPAGGDPRHHLDRHARRERFYWGAILVTFALGTAAGDLATEALSLGFRNGVLIFGGLHRRSPTWPVGSVRARSLTFWVAYVLTRPLGRLAGRPADPGHVARRPRARRQPDEHPVPGRDRRAGRPRAAAWSTGTASPRRAAGRSAAGVATSAGPSAVPSAVVVLGLALAGSCTRPDDVGRRRGRPGRAGGLGGPAVHPTTALGDLSRFSAIVTSVQGKVAQNDLAGAKTNVKDLEVAWDSAEAGLKPRDPKNWSQLDGEIDAGADLVARQPPDAGRLRAALDTLAKTLNAFDGV